MTVSDLPVEGPAARPVHPTTSSTQPAYRSAQALTVPRRILDQETKRAASCDRSTRTAGSVPRRCGRGERAYRLRGTRTRNQQRRAPGQHHTDLTYRIYRIYRIYLSYLARPHDPGTGFHPG